MRPLPTTGRWARSDDACLWLGRERIHMDEIWDLWIPNVGATGLSFARTLVDAASASAGDRVLVHAAPQHLEVTVRDEEGSVVARGEGLERGAPGPMCFLVRDGTGCGWRTAGLVTPTSGGWSSCRAGRPGCCGRGGTPRTSPSGVDRSSSPTTSDRAWAGFTCRTLG